MIITFSPIRLDDGLSLARRGDCLVLNGESFDFAALPDGASLPLAAITSDRFADDVTRRMGVLHIPLLLPIRSGAAADARFPAPVAADRDGTIDLPRGAITKTLR